LSDPFLGLVGLEQALLMQTRCKVYVFDPLLTFQQQLAVERAGGVTFLGYGIGPSDGTVRLVDRRQGNPASNISHFQAKSLASIMLVLPSPCVPCEGPMWLAELLWAAHLRLKGCLTKKGASLSAASPRGVLDICFVWLLRLRSDCLMLGHLSVFSTCPTWSCLVVCPECCP
jgi:hypothetical protein